MILKDKDFRQEASLTPSLLKLQERERERGRHIQTERQRQGEWKRDPDRVRREPDKIKQSSSNDSYYTQSNSRLRITLKQSETK